MAAANANQLAQLTVFGKVERNSSQIRDAIAGAASVSVGTICASEEGANAAESTAITSESTSAAVLGATAIPNLDANDNVLFQCFDISKLEHLPKYSYSHWDETHRKAYVGHHKNRTYKFPYDEQDNVDLFNGSFNEMCDFLKQAKCQDEINICLGVAIVQLPNGQVIGKYLLPSDYTNKTIAIASDMYRHEENDM
eukprot:14968802-Ditylum_brightwellii.AAC.1